MAYCSPTDLLQMVSQEELAELTTATGEVPDSQVTAEAIAWAEDEVNAYVGARYQVPLNPVPAKIKGLTVELALYSLYARRGVAPAVRRERYEAAMAFLKRVAEGLAVLEGVSGGVSGRAIEPAEVESGARRFSRDQMGDW